MADPRHDYARIMSRRSFFRASGTGIGFAALATLLREDLGAAPAGSEAFGGLPDLPHFAPKAKRVIYLVHVRLRRRIWICSTTSPTCGTWRARSCRIRCGKGSSSPP